MTKYMIRYPVKIGFGDGSGKKENFLADARDKCFVHGWGDCCQVGGIQDKSVAKAIVKVLNEKKPRIYIDD